VFELVREFPEEVGDFLESMGVEVAELARYIRGVKAPWHS